MATKKAAAKKPAMVVTKETGVTVVEEDFLDGIETFTPQTRTITKVAPVAKTVPNPRHNGEKDQYGFGVKTVGSFIMHYLADGKHTRKELEAAFTGTEFHAWGRGEDTKRTKTSLTVFLSDVKKPFGQYHAARSLIILEGENGKLTLEPKRLAVIEKVVANGILDDLKGLNPREHLDEIKAVRKKFGVPVE